MLRRNAGLLDRRIAGRRSRGLLLFALFLGFAGWAGTALPVRAELLSETYEFKTDVPMAVGTQTDGGLRIDTVEFIFPTAIDGKLQRTSGLARVEVALSNASNATHKIGIAIALFDKEIRLLGVASGGSRVAGLKPGRQRTYKLFFDGVNAEAFKAETFQISVEAR